MKAVVLLDDLELHEGGNVIASTPVRLGWDGIWYDLDLTDEHARDLFNGLKPYLEAGRRASTAPAVDAGRERAAIEAASADPSIPRHGRVVLYHAVGKTTRTYWREFREWAAANGYEIRQYQDRTYSHPVDLVEEYERHLALLDRKSEQAS